MRKIQRIRGLATTPKTVDENALYTGHRGELVSIFDADGKVASPYLMVHDGVTVGGWKYDNLQVPGGETEGTADTGSKSSQPPSAQGISSGWLTESVIDYSAYFDGSSYLTRPEVRAGSSNKMMTGSFWVKMSLPNRRSFLFGHSNTSGSDTYSLMSEINSSNQISILCAGVYQRSYAILRDTSAWYHIVVSLDSTATTTERLKIFLNGDELAMDTSFSGGGFPSDTSDLCLSGHRFYLSDPWSSRHLNGYMANVQFIDGAAPDASYFGETVEGNWIHRPYDGTSTVEGATPVSGLSENDIYGKNGFYLNFADESNLGKDVSGNGNDWE